MLVKWLNFPHMKLFQKPKACQTIPWYKWPELLHLPTNVPVCEIQHSFILYLRMPNSKSISREMLLWHAVVKLKQVGRKNILASNENGTTRGSAGKLKQSILPSQHKEALGKQEKQLFQHLHKENVFSAPLPSGNKYTCVTKSFCSRKWVPHPSMPECFLVKFHFPKDPVGPV